MGNIIGIYSITNTVNGKRYVGSTTNFKERIRQHFKLLRKNKHHSCHLQYAFNKYGESAFVSVIIEHVPIELLIDAEQKHLDANLDGYNIARCAKAPARGRRASAETRAKMSEAHKGFRMSPEHKEKLIAANTNRHISTETRVRLGNGNRGRTLSPEWRDKIGSAGKGRIVSKETRDKVGAAHKGKVMSQEARDKMSASHKGVPLSPEHRANMSAAKKGIVKSPEWIAKIIAAKSKNFERKRIEDCLIKSNFENCNL